MKEISKNKYDLNESYLNTPCIPVGTLLAYILICDCGMSFTSLSAVGNKEQLRFDDRWLLPDLKLLGNMFMSKNLDVWELRCCRDGVRLTITGSTWETVLNVRADAETDISSLMTAVEKRTHAYKKDTC